MCLLCKSEELENDAMAEPWDELKEALVGTLTEGIKDFVSDVKPELQDFIVKKAEEAAKWKWESIHAGSDAEREEAKQNLLHIAAQVGGEAARLELVAGKHAKNLLKKVFDVALGVLVKIAPALLGI